MKKVAFIGLSFHKKTQSSQFFIDLLNRYFITDIFWDTEDNCQDDKNKDALCEPYDAIIYWQIMPNIIKLKYSYCKNIILVPMYDHVVRYNDWDFLNYKDFKFINFSKSLDEKLRNLGLESLYLQYFPTITSMPIRSTISCKKKFKIFFWQRGKDINLSLIKELLPVEQIDSMILHRLNNEKEQDIWFEEASKEDIKNYNIKLSSWFNTKNDFLEALNDCDIFISPRLFEGIGMSFLEAMALGKCVIAPNLPTMNEYIIDNFNGILFEVDNLKKLDLSNCITLGSKAKEYIKNGLSKWDYEKENIPSFILKKNMITNIKRSSFIPFDKNMVFSKNLNLIEQYLTQKFTQPNSVILYGAGTGAKIILSFIKEQVDFIVDINKSLHNTTINDKIIKSPLSLLDYKDKKIIITVFGREEKIYQYLQNELLVAKRNIIIVELFN